MTQPDRHVLVVYGPAGCGKTTIAQYLSDTFNFSYIEGDNVSAFCLCDIHGNSVSRCYSITHLRMSQK
jgi:replication-associated recombination protein RarA